MKSQKYTFKFFTNAKCRRITTDDYESIPHGWIINNTEETINAVTANAVTANLILNIEPEPINTPLHQKWIHRRTALIQTTLDGAAQKRFSLLPIEIKSDWKRFTQEFSKMFDSERNKQHQRVLCNEIRKLPNETIKQLAVRIETLVRKAYSLNTHD